MPVNWNNYPPFWKKLRKTILQRAGDRCEFCGAVNYAPHPVTGSKVILTIAHLDHNTTHNDVENLRALCQKCHLTYDAKQHATNAAITRRKKKERAGQLPLFLC